MHGLVWLVCILAQVVWCGLYGLVCKLGTTMHLTEDKLSNVYVCEKHFKYRKDAILEEIHALFTVL